MFRNKKHYDVTQSAARKEDLLFAVSVFGR